MIILRRRERRLHTPVSEFQATHVDECVLNQEMPASFCCIDLDKSTRDLELVSDMQLTEHQFDIGNRIECDQITTRNVISLRDRLSQT